MMTDDLHFDFEDHDDRARNRRRRGTTSRNGQDAGRRGQQPEVYQGHDQNGYDNSGYYQQDPNGYYQQGAGYGYQQGNNGYQQDPNGYHHPQQQHGGYQQQQPGYYQQDGYYYAEPETQGRAATRAKAAGKKKKKKKGRSGMALVMSLLLLAGLGGGVYLAYDKVMGMFTTPDFDGEGAGEVQIEVPKGASGIQIASVLFKAGVIKSAKAFVEQCDRNRDDADRLQPGLYRLRKEMSAAAAMALMLKPESRLINGITIPEGLSTFKIYKLLAEKTKLPEADFKTAGADPIALGVPEAWFARKDGKTAPKSSEGFLFPDTYEFPPKATAKEILTLMVKRFLQVAGELKMTEKFAADPKVSPYQALIVASLAQAEAGNADDLGKVARVAYNRVYKRIPELSCACTEFDVTVNYSLELKGLDPKESKNMTEKELTDPKNPYNRKAEGLVPTPINNPGKHALQAATTPTEGNWYYFVAIDKQGHSAFSSTFSQFCKDNQTAVKNGILNSSSC